MRRHASMPSSTGISMSINTTSGRNDFAISTAFSPSGAVPTTWWPSCSITATITCLASKSVLCDQYPELLNSPQHQLLRQG